MKTKEQIIALYDLENFVRIAKKLNSRETFSLINEIHSLSIESVKGFSPHMIKSVGDSTMMVFDDEKADEIIRELHTLKQKIEELLISKGFNNKASFSCHYGELTSGTLGVPPFESFDAFGEAINTTFVMNGKPFPGRFIISPQLFRKLNKETRKLYHKYTPQIVYIAD